MRSPFSRLRLTTAAVLVASTSAWADPSEDSSFEDVRLGVALHEMRHAITWKRQSADWQLPILQSSGDSDPRAFSSWRAYEQLDAWGGWRLMPAVAGLPPLRLDDIPWLRQPINFGNWRMPQVMNDIPCVVPIPEPAAATLALVGALALWATRRRPSSR